MKWPEENFSANLPNICRLCMAEGTECMQQIFAECEHDGERFQLSSRIKAVTSLKVEPGDQLPEQACQHCVAQINRWYDFKMLCESSDTILRQQLGHSNSDVEVIMDFDTVGESLQTGLLFNGDSFSNNQQVEPITNGFSSPLPFVCTLCEARFSRKMLLKQHIAAHCGEPPHPCNRCNAGFTQKVELVKHMLTHSPVQRVPHRVYRPSFACAVCQCSFRSPQSLLHHQTSHSTVFRFRCIYCSLACMSTVQLRFHLRQHVRKRTTCSRCHNTFSSSFALYGHQCQVSKTELPFHT
ncbi:hypothetical protein R5R35_010072 [Gryllus longicercus]|uniref:Zinc finger protein n=1 Tax=Gryllus longicercus TaxID=2509291 RepID=A0AAN9VR47_9ORTH